MTRLALIGKDLSYSQSRQIHTFIAESMGNNIGYDYYAIQPEQLEATLNKLFCEYKGFNITIPYKETILPYLSKLSSDASVYSSVNTVVCSNKKGYNTDGEGFMLMLRSEGIDVKNQKVLVLGSGGAAKSCVYKLCKAGASVYVYNRTLENAKKLYSLYGGFTVLESLESSLCFDIIINTTSVGMTSLKGRMPISEEIAGTAHTLVDLIYNPPKTELLLFGERNSKKIVNGEKMLFFQAYYAQTVYFNLKADDKQAQNLFIEYKKGSVSI